MPFLFFETAIRYVTACGQDPTSPLALSPNSTCLSGNSNLGEINITWGVLQSFVAFVLWISCALVGLRARRGSSALLPSTIALYIVIAMATYGVYKSRDDWTPDFYTELGCWVAAFLVALIFYCFDLERVPLGGFVFVTIAGGACMIAEYIKPGTFGDGGDVSEGALCAIFAAPAVVGGVIGGFCCRKRRLHSGSVFSSLQSGLDEDSAYHRGGDVVDTVRYGGAGHITLHILAGSICQAFVVAPLAFASSKFEGCPAIWQLSQCHQESYDAALAVCVTTFAAPAVMGFIVQSCWACRSTREAADRNRVNPELTQHFASSGAADVAGDDLASRGVLKGQATPHLDNRWTKMTNQDGY